MFFCLHLKTKKKKICGFKQKDSRISKNLNFFTKWKTFKTHFFKILSLVNLPCGQVMSHKKFGPDRFSLFDVYWIQANKQTDKPNLYIDNPLKTSMYPIKYSVSYNIYPNIFRHHLKNRGYQYPRQLFCNLYIQIL